MGLSYRKSVKIGKNTRINLSKNGGVGISTGVKGARVSVNKKGIRKTAGVPKSGIYYTKQEGWDKSKDSKSNINTYNEINEIALPEGVNIPSTPIKIKLWLYSGIVLLIIGFFNALFLVPAMAAIIVDIVLMLTNKDYKCSLNMQFAINKYKQGDFQGCRKYAEKALKYRECESARILIKEIEGYL